MVLVRAARRWWTQSDPQSLFHSQDKLFQTLVKAPFVRTSSGGLNSVEFAKNNAAPDSDTIVLAHGFGSGLGFFYQNVDALLSHSSVGRVILVDWLGMGGSDRPQCSQRPIRGWSEYTTGWCDSRFSPSQAVDFFIEPFHEWMQLSVLNQANNHNNNTGKLVLMGHSLGGYLSARYAVQYPMTVNKLVLASPVGFPRKPDSSTLLKGSQLPTSLRVVDALWSSNLTPQQLVRLMGSTRGRTNIQRALQGRIPHLNPNNGRTTTTRDLELLADYLYHITVADPSGEFAMNSLLEPAVSSEIMGVFAREPLEDHLLVNLDTTESAIQQIKVIFGDHDWMRPNEPSARDTLERVKQRHGINVSVDVIPNAGHHLYMDNSKEFVRHILE